MIVAKLFFCMELGQIVSEAVSESASRRLLEVTSLPGIIGYLICKLQRIRKIGTQMRMTFRCASISSQE